MKYEIGDIVWVEEFKSNEKVSCHLFVVISDDGELVPFEYFGFVISSNLQKSKEVSPYKYNEPIHKNDNNNLKSDSIVKCDQLFTIPHENIVNKIGYVDAENLERFLDSFEKFLNENK